MAYIIYCRDDVIEIPTIEYTVGGIDYLYKYR